MAMIEKPAEAYVTSVWNTTPKSSVLQAAHGNGCGSTDRTSSIRYNNNSSAVSTAFIYCNGHTSATGSHRLSHLSDAAADLFSSAAAATTQFDSRRQPLPAPAVAPPPTTTMMTTTTVIVRQVNCANVIGSEKTCNGQPKVIGHSSSFVASPANVATFVDSVRNVVPLRRSQEPVTEQVHARNDDTARANAAKMMTSSMSEEDKRRRRENLQRMVSGAAMRTAVSKQ